MEEVAKTHSERLKFLDPELESTNTRIEVLETICKANELKINSLSKLRDMRKEIVKINDRSSHTEKHHTRQGNYPVHPLQQLFFSASFKVSFFLFLVTMTFTKMDRHEAFTIAMLFAIPKLDLGSSASP